MASLPALLVFCDYLEARLHTSSLGLLRRILSDFFAGNEHTLHDFMRLGASVVSVMPVERKGPGRRAEAARLLAQQKQPQNVLDLSANQMDTREQTRTPEDTQPSHPCVFRYLSARVATKNILWLRDMFHEFRAGEDKLVKEFVRLGCEPITVIPVDIQALCMAPLPPPPLLAAAAFKSVTEATAATDMTSPSSTVSPQKKRLRGPSEEGGVADGRTQKQSRRSPVVTREREPESLSEIALSQDEMRKVLVRALERVEEKEPWLYTFKPETLSLPFSRMKYPALVASLVDFWKTHARAVWERKFWAPLSRLRTPEPHKQRRFRQSKAQTFFENKVLLPVYEEFGAGFFVKMDRRTEFYSGWFYLDQAVDLFTLAQRVGLRKCLHYIETEATKRYPVPPGASRHFFSRVNGKSRSMWSSAEALQPVLVEIVAMKKAKKMRVRA